jgi:aspartate/methionine/tyrosine aminotransferase
VLSGLSKVCGLPNLKLGWIVVQGPEGEREAAKKRLAWIADTYLSTASTVQQALPKLLEAGKTVQQQIRERITANRQALIDGGLNILASDGGWYGIIQLGEERTDEEWALHLLQKHGIIVHPGYFYDIPIESCVVVSLLAEPAAFNGLVEIV